MDTCPICGSEAEMLPRTGDADGLNCPLHGHFKVSGSALETRTDASRAEWERAFDRAKLRTKPGEIPLIMDADF